MYKKGGENLYWLGYLHAAKLQTGNSIAVVKRKDN
jgi:hypothetical protein